MFLQLNVNFLLRFQICEIFRNYSKNVGISVRFLIVLLLNNFHGHIHCTIMNSYFIVSCSSCCSIVYYGVVQVLGCLVKIMINKNLSTNMAKLGQISERMLLIGSPPHLSSMTINSRSSDLDLIHLPTMTTENYRFTVHLF